MPLNQFSAPAFVQDFKPEQVRAWSSLVDFWIKREVKLLKGDDQNKPVLFFNELTDPVPEDAPVKPIPWDGFPRSLKLRFQGDALWEAAKPLRSVAASAGGRLFAIREGTPVEVDYGYRNQDEYLEWLETPGEQPGSIKKITFTCESPEYWTFIAGGTKALVNEEDLPLVTEVVEGDHDLLLELYRRYVSPDVQLEDLRYPHDVRLLVSEDGQPKVYAWAERGDYNPYNKWNTTHGIMHLTHPANTLRAEINIAARATVLRKNRQGDRVEDAVKLICCSGYGGVNRSSDPTIGSVVNDLARQGLSVTLRDPVGLYINEIDKQAFEGPQAQDVSDAWTIVDNRGREGMILRAEFRVPEGRGFDVHQVLVDGEAIRFGGQVANKIGMVLTGKAHNFNLPALRLEACRNHCCTSPTNRDLLVILEPNEKCKDLEPKDRWAETFDDLIPAAAPPVAPGPQTDVELVPDRFDEARFAMGSSLADEAAADETKDMLLSEAPKRVTVGGTRNERDGIRSHDKE